MCRPRLPNFMAFEGPAFLEVIIDPDAMVYPMVGPGQSYADMITGEHIPAREQRPKKKIDPTSMF